jgi:hypothetical protein
MGSMAGHEAFSQNTRRWPRFQVKLPVRIVAINGILTTPVVGRGGEISRAGMALRAPINLNPGDSMQLQFPTTNPSRVTAVVRNRVGDQLGLEFLTQLPPDDQARSASTALAPTALVPTAVAPTRLVPASSRKFPSVACTPQNVFEGLRRKQEERRQVQREIEALKMAILLLADSEGDLSRLSALVRMERGPWPGA